MSPAHEAGVHESRSGLSVWSIRVLRSEQSSGGDEDSRIALEAGKPGW